MVHFCKVLSIFKIRSCKNSLNAPIFVIFQCAATIQERPLLAGVRYMYIEFNLPHFEISQPFLCYQTAHELFEVVLLYLTFSRNFFYW